MLPLGQEVAQVEKDHSSGAMFASFHQKAFSLEFERRRNFSLKMVPATSHVCILKKTNSFFCSRVIGFSHM